MAVNVDCVDPAVGVKRRHAIFVRADGQAFHVALLNNGFRKNVSFYEDRHLEH